MEGTFADWLVRKGVKFHPETVIIDVTETLVNNKHKRYRELRYEILELAGSTHWIIDNKKHLSEILYSWLALPTYGISHREYGFSVESEDLVTLENEHPIIERILLYREVCNHLTKDYHQLLQATCVPPFDNCFIQWDTQLAGGNLFHGIYLTNVNKQGNCVTADMYHFGRVTLDGEYYPTYSNGSRINWADGIVVRDTSDFTDSEFGWDLSVTDKSHILHLLLLSDFDAQWIPVSDYLYDERLEPEAYLDALDYYADVALTSLSMLHQKAPLELVNYPRNYRRRIKRKTGKEPSPYFMLKVKPEQTRTKNEYEYPKREKNEKSTMPLTLVRGHFRHVENHPIEHFNGTHWIPAHTKGHKDNGEIKKGYTIVLE